MHRKKIQKLCDTTLATLGQNPLQEHPILIAPLPGQRTRYTAERNFLLLERASGKWSACWDLEASGKTDPLRL
jgi:hypothetical protein